ncbi:alpha/beta hydrolase family esterase [Acutalibacter caecimuris]|uniref:alpha/beta hydrolase family esterase n=1 Tax=Acutalibacter caecimuris TaxID=3093657 RepID=UPI002AC9723A|nr:hypothetical protein [Acutalibacter sp. M00118]
MGKEIKLRAGTPDDNNRDYLPERIKGSDIVVNENGNNSQPYPERLQEFHAVLNQEGEMVENPEEGIAGTWYEYVPESFDPTRKTPLVMSLHGGLMTGWGQCIYSSWSLLAEREGFLCVFPNGNTNRFWQMQYYMNRHRKKPAPINGLSALDPAPTIEENIDCNFLLRLLKYIQKKYPVDEKRIFMQGMSNGCGMTQQFARRYGYLLAGAAHSAGPGRIWALIDEEHKLINQGGPLAVWDNHPENNGHGNATLADEARSCRESRHYWMTINQCEPMPKISIVGEDNMAFFSGKKAPYVFNEIKIRDHGQALDEAFLYWDYLFAGTRRGEDGEIIQEATPLAREGDQQAAAFAPGMARAWWHNQPVELDAAPVRWQKLKYHGLNGDQLVRGEYTCVPLTCLATIAGGTLETAPDGLTAVMSLPDGRRLQFARGSIGCLIDGRLRSMYCEALHREGQLLVSVEWFARSILGWTATECNGVTYITDHHAELGYCMADLIKDILQDRVLPENFIEEALKE